jgi:hypothetical protein
MDRWMDGWSCHCVHSVYFLFDVIYVIMRSYYAMFLSTGLLDRYSESIRAAAISEESQLVS